MQPKATTLNPLKLLNHIHSRVKTWQISAPNAVIITFESLAITILKMCKLYNYHHRTAKT